MARGPHYRLTFSGIFGTAAAPQEQWQFSLNLNGTSTVATAEQLAVPLGTWRQAYQTLMGGITHAQNILTKVDVRYIGADGKQPRAADGSFIGSTFIVGDWPGTSTSGVRYDPQTALVVSLGSNRAGPRGKGRIYLPSPNFSLDTDYRLPKATVDTFAASAATFINSVNSAALQVPNVGKVSVMSTFGTASTVTKVSVGRVLDTHRSRRRALLEDRTVVAVA